MFDMLSGWAACVLISVIKLPLGFHKKSRRPRAPMLCRIKIRIKSKRLILNDIQLQFKKKKKTPNGNNFNFESDFE